MSSRQPAVSVIVPAFNAATIIVEALDSIRAQQVPDVEVVVIDDGSTDDTIGVVTAFDPEIVVLTQANGGPGAARNRGLARASGSVIAFLDADDRWPADSLRARLQALAAHPEAAIVQGRLQDLWPSLEEEGAWVLEEPPRNGFNVGSAVFRREVFDKVGGFDESLRYGEDVDLLVRIEAEGFRRVRIPDVALIYRRRLVDDIDAQHRHYRNLTGAIKRVLDRKRQGAA